MKRAPKRWVRRETTHQLRSVPCTHIISGMSLLTPGDEDSLHDFYLCRNHAIVNKITIFHSVPRGRGSSCLELNGRRRMAGSVGR